MNENDLYQYLYQLNIQHGLDLNKYCLYINNNEQKEENEKNNENKNTISLMTFNIMRDDRVNQIPHLSWKSREERIIKIIQDANPDILCLQECRDLPNEKIENFLNKLKSNQYNYFIHSNKSKSRLKLATLWKYEKFHFIFGKTYFLNENVEKKYLEKRPLGLLVLKPANNINQNNNPYLFIYNSHFGHDKEEKDITVKLVPEMINYHIEEFLKQFIYSKKPNISYLLMADTNFFLLQNGQEQLKILCEQHPTIKFQHLTENSICIYKNENYKNMKGTFLGSSIDKFKPDKGEIGNELDVILGSKDIKLIKSFYWNKTMLKQEPENILFETDIFPSDHIPVLIYITLL